MRRCPTVKARTREAGASCREAGRTRAVKFLCCVSTWATVVAIAGSVGGCTANDLDASGRRGAEAVLNALDQIAVTVPGAPAGTKLCDDRAIGKARRVKEWPVKLNGFEYRALKQALQGQPVSDRAAWAWMNSSHLRNVWRGRKRKGRMGHGTTQRLLRVGQRGHVVVFRDRSRAKPVAGASAFKPGHWKGGLYVFNIRTRALACYTPVEANSSADFTAPSGPRAIEPQTAADRDLQRNFEAAATQAIRSISASVQILLQPTLG